VPWWGMPWPPEPFAPGGGGPGVCSGPEWRGGGGKAARWSALTRSFGPAPRNQPHHA
jgi:hypothetical protein